ncbi:MAG: hypothetical protein ACSLFN_03715 [Candidatus Limnocylindrales bacterium]
MNWHAALDRYPMNSPWVRSLVQRYGLPLWFVCQSVLAIAQSSRDTSLLYFDGRLYLLATQAWLDGRDPWSIQLAGNYFAAPPPSMVPLVPLAMLPIDIGVAILAGMVIASSVLTVRLLGLPWWWLAFPPLVQSALSANVHSLLIPLILMPLGAIAGLLKIYGVVPMVILGRWRALAGLAVLLGVTAPVLPWSSYIEGFGSINARLVEQTTIALPTVVLVAAAPFALVAMRIVGRERAAWLAVPALWPSQQYYYGTLAMGARSGLAAAIVAVPVPGSGLLALIALALATWRANGRASASRPGSGASPRTIGAVTGGTGGLDSSDDQRT